MRESGVWRGLGFGGTKAAPQARIAAEDALEDASQGLPGLRTACRAKGLLTHGSEVQLRARLGENAPNDDVPHGLPEVLSTGGLFVTPPAATKSSDSGSAPELIPDGRPMEKTSGASAGECTIKGLRATCLAKCLAIGGSKDTLLARIAEHDATHDLSQSLPGLRAACLAKGLPIIGSKARCRARIAADGAGHVG